MRKSQKTYIGRVKYFFSVYNPMQCLLTDGKIQWAKEKMEEYNLNEKMYGGMHLTPKQLEELKKAYRIYNAVYHPDTKEKIPFIFRMSSFTPMNIPVIFGLICAKQTIFNVVFWQWVNQTYNAFWNYSNRNATSSFTKKEFSLAYTGAATSSIAIALGGRWLTKRFGTTSGTISSQRFRNGLVSLCALSIAGFINLFLIRYNEIHKGIIVKHKDKPCGTSKAAAKKAVVASALTRSFLPLPLTLVPALCWKVLEMVRLAPKRRFGILAADIVITTVALTVSLPLAISLFSQELSINREKIESEFKNLNDIDGNPIMEFAFNKGL